jgi:glutamate/tyrosine decarboxylase-like PLP-dependent enzyme
MSNTPNLCEKMSHEREDNDKALFERAKQYAYEYMDDVDRRSVYPSEEAITEMRRQFADEPLPATIAQDPLTAILEPLHRYGAPATTSSTGGRYFGFVNGNSLPVASAVGWMTQVWDQNAALYAMSPISATLEHILEKWIPELLFKDSVHGDFDGHDIAMGLVGGTSVANLCGLAAARHCILKRQGWSVNEDGLFGAPPIRVVTSQEAHSSIKKALSLLGLGNSNKCVERVPVDDQGRICVDQLPTLDATTIVILQAGHVGTGAFDDFDSICKLASEAGAWVHVDGAFGLWAAASRSLQYLTKGLERADSWSVDGHKSLNTPYDCGIILCKHRDMLTEAMAATGSYLQRGNAAEQERDGMFYTPDMSRRGGRAIELWATLKYLGREGVEQLMDGLVANAQSFGRLLDEAGFDIQNDIVFNQCLFKCATPQETSETLKHIQSSGVLWCGGTTWKNEPAIRISVCSWSTTFEDVKKSVQAIIEARDQVVTSGLQ